MEKKKMKLWKKISIGILLILLILTVIILVRYSILTDIQAKNEENDKKLNCYYYSETENSILEYWRKDGVMKLNAKHVNGTGNITFWENTNTKEEFVFWNSPEKIYSKGNGGMVKRLPNGMMFTEKNHIRFLMAANPALYIGSVKYDNKECYKLKIDEQEEIIEKSTGLILYSNTGEENKIKYSFDTVTDEDVQMPDISQYKFK